MPPPTGAPGHASGPAGPTGPAAPLPEPPPHLLPPVQGRLDAGGPPPGWQPQLQQVPQGGWNAAPGWSPPPRPEVADRPRPYPQLLRGPDHRWWKPLVSLVFAVVVGFGIILAGSVVALVLILASGGFDSMADVESQLSDEAFYSEPAGFAMNNLILAALIPTAMVAVWLVHRWRPRWLSSVKPGIRWGWLAECTAWSLVFVGALFALGLLLDDESLSWSPQKHFWVFVAIVLVTQPLQAAGEEYAFRGLLTQAVGSWFANPVVSAVVGGVVSSTLFAVAHGSQSPWLFADRFFFGAAASVLVWRTGGLEAGIALHAVNNLYAIGVALVTGTLAESLTATDYPPVAAVVDIALISLVTAAMCWRAERRGLQRLHDPALQPDRWRAAGWPVGVGAPAVAPAGPWGAYAALAAQQPYGQAYPQAHPAQGYPQQPYAQPYGQQPYGPGQQPYVSPYPQQPPAAQPYPGQGYPPAPWAPPAYPPAVPPGAPGSPPAVPPSEGAPPAERG